MKSLDERDAAVSSERSEPRTHSAPSAPLPIALSELGALIGYRVARRSARALDGHVKHLADLAFRGLLAEEGEADDASREVMHDDRKPPAPWLALGQREREPRSPESGRGHGGQIDVPNVSRIV
jgi:hypothetical protein